MKEEKTGLYTSIQGQRHHHQPSGRIRRRKHRCRELVAKEQGLNYDADKAVKQEYIMQDATKTYLTALAFTDLNSERHKNLKTEVKHNWVRNNVDSLPRTYECLLEIEGGYRSARYKPRRDPRSPGMVFVNTTSRGRGDKGCEGRDDRAGRGGRGEHGNQEEKNKNEDGSDKQEGGLSNMNNKGQSSFWNCGNQKHWKYQCPKLTVEEQA